MVGTLLMGTGAVCHASGLSAITQGSAEAAALHLQFYQGFLGQLRGNFIRSQDLQYYFSCNKKLILHMSVCLALEL